MEFVGFQSKNLTYITGKAVNLQDEINSLKSECFI